MTEANKKFMQLALQQAQIAFDNDEVPIGAVVVQGDKVIAVSHNTRQQSKNATEHAELVAISNACKALNDWRLVGCDLYVTMEPCVMCLGACYNARISNLYFGAYDLSGQGCIPISQMLETTLNHSINVCGGVLEHECSAMLSDYFAKKRNVK